MDSDSDFGFWIQSFLSISILSHSRLAIESSIEEFKVDFLRGKCVRGGIAIVPRGLNEVANEFWQERFLLRLVA